MLATLLIVFVTMLVLLKVLFFTKVTAKHIIVMTCVLAILVVLAYDPNTKRLREPFVDATATEASKLKFLGGLLSQGIANTINTQYQKASTGYNENVPQLRNGLQLYVSCYSTKSYNGYGKILYNIAPKTTMETSSTVQCTPDGQVLNRDFVFKEKPSFSKEKGFFMGPNVVEGPLSHALGIQGNGEFTMVVQCSHDTLPTGKSINIFKVFANTSNNLGVSLDISEVNNTQVIQTGKLAVSFTDKGTFPCKLKDVASIPFDKKISYVYAIVKTNTTLTVYMLSSIDNKPNTLLTLNNTSDVLFSNKPMLLNANGVWPGYLKMFSVYNIALTPDELLVLYGHVIGEEKKLDVEYQKKQAQIAQLTNTVQSLKECPFDKATCDKCGKIKEWNNFNNIVSADKECLNTIDNFCLANTTHDLCKCWDPKYDKYNSIACQNWKNIFKNKETLNLDNLSASHLEQIKNKYKLLASAVLENKVPGELKTLQLDLSTSKENLKALAATPTPTPENTQSQIQKKGFFEWLLGRT